MGLAYYLICPESAEESPRGIFVMDVRSGGAILWNHRGRSWVYDPGLVTRFLDDYRNADRYQSVERQVVQGFVRDITGQTALPDEAAFRAMLAGGAGHQRASGGR
ncbi:hypothetical protein ABTX15_05045 [Micromonospora sp. NPDC094482]|uniref:hypothetical protein n=1 Tax=unclassified Micromonospora TaxID=2617518 RepID=UPI00331CEA96